jgi:hypothetical protein
MKYEKRPTRGGYWGVTVLNEKWKRNSIDPHKLWLMVEIANQRPIEMPLNVDINESDNHLAVSPKRLYF